MVRFSLGKDWGPTGHCYIHPDLHRSFLLRCSSLQVPSSTVVIFFWKHHKMWPSWASRTRIVNVGMSIHRSSKKYAENACLVGKHSISMYQLMYSPMRRMGRTSAQGPQSQGRGGEWYALIISLSASDGPSSPKLIQMDAQTCEGGTDGKASGSVPRGKPEYHFHNFHQCAAHEKAVWELWLTFLRPYHNILCMSSLALVSCNMVLGCCRGRLAFTITSPSLASQIWAANLGLVHVAGTRWKSSCRFAGWAPKHQLLSLRSFFHSHWYLFDLALVVGSLLGKPRSWCSVGVGQDPKNGEHPKSWTSDWSFVVNSQGSRLLTHSYLDLMCPDNMLKTCSSISKFRMDTLISRGLGGCRFINACPIICPTMQENAHISRNQPWT